MSAADNIAERVPRREGRQKVTGSARFSSDTEMPGQLYAGILRSPHANARVRSLDDSAVRAVPGVRDVITADDVQGMHWYEEKVLTFSERVRFVGDEVAAVVADTEEAVQDALRAFELEYDVLDAVVGLDAACAADAPQLHDDKPGNLAAEPQIYERGNTGKGFAAADVIVEATYATQTALHNALEPHGCNASWDGETLDLWVSTQGIFAVRKGIAQKLGLALNRVRVHAEHVGGGFGAKQVDWKPTLIAAVLSMRNKRPVKLLLDREAENLAAGNRNATRQHVRLGATRDGRLCAIAARISVDGGAYRLGGESSNVGGCYQRLYACENVRTEQRQYYTNAGPSVAFRAPGFVEGTFALEQAMDELAGKLEMDPFTLRERNYTKTDQVTQKPYSSPDALQHCYAAAREAFAWPTDAAERDRGRKRRGIGMAASVWVGGGLNPPALAAVSMQADGSVTVHTGAQDIGTGTRTVLGQIAAKTLDVALQQVTVLLGDTAGELYSPTSAGSATLPSVGPAVEAAAAELRQQILQHAADCLETSAENLTLVDGCVRGKGDAQRYLSLAELAASLPAGTLKGRSANTDKPDDRSLKTFAVQCAEVEVDLDTAEVTVLRLVCAPDCGAVINPLLADSQVIGGATQGLGFAMSEGRIMDRSSGLVLNANLEDYLVPTILDVPPVTHALVNLPDYSENRLGVKGLGEPPLIATAPAIINAVHDAIGLRVRELPLNHKKLLDLMCQTGDVP